MIAKADKLAAGQSWTYRTPAGFESSRLIIGAVVRLEDERTIICAAASNAPTRQANSNPAKTNIAFIPMSERAFRASVLACDNTNATPPDIAGFQKEIQSWQTDPRGLSVFTVPFEGQLDRMIALQMADIVGKPAA